MVEMVNDGEDQGEEEAQEQRKKTCAAQRNTEGRDWAEQEP